MCHVMEKFAIWFQFCYQAFSVVDGSATWINDAFQYAINHFRNKFLFYNFRVQSESFDVIKWKILSYNENKRIFPRGLGREENGGPCIRVCNYIFSPLSKKSASLNAYISANMSRKCVRHVSKFK